jgi:hypothetical protein
MKKIFFLAAIISGMVAINSCDKDDPDFDQPVKGASAQVAIDWYKLQLRILLERNSTLNGVYFGYIGIGLYEAVRHELKNSVSLSTKLHQMPVMPAKEKNNGYNWEVSANAAMASMLRSFNIGVLTL